MGYNENPPYFLTAYEIAVKRGFRGTEDEWLESLTCYSQAQVAGYTGTIENWIETLVDPVPKLQIGEVVTLEGGSKATATITGDKKNPVLNLGIPRGVGMADALPIIGGTMRGGINMNGNVLNGIPAPTENSHVVNKEYADQFLLKSGGTMTGHLSVPAPTEKAHPVTMEYADQFLPKTGGTMTGALTVLEPKESGHAVPKAYVDGKHKTKTITLTVSAWADHLQTAVIPDVTADMSKTDVFVSPDPEDTNYAAYQESGVRLYAQQDGAVVFKCGDVPERDLIVNVAVRR